MCNVIYYSVTACYCLYCMISQHFTSLINLWLLMSNLPQLFFDRGPFPCEIQRNGTEVPKPLLKNFGANYTHMMSTICQQVNIGQPSGCHQPQCNSIWCELTGSQSNVLITGDLRNSRYTARDPSTNRGMLRVVVARSRCWFTARGTMPRWLGTFSGLGTLSWPFSDFRHIIHWHIHTFHVERSVVAFRRVRSLHHGRFLAFLPPRTSQGRGQVSALTTATRVRRRFFDPWILSAFTRSFWGNLRWISSWKLPNAGPTCLCWYPWLPLKLLNLETIWLHLKSAWCTEPLCRNWDHTMYTAGELDDSHQMRHNQQDNRCRVGRASNLTSWSKIIPMRFAWQRDLLMWSWWCVEAFRRLGRFWLAGFWVFRWWN